MGPCHSTTKEDKHDQSTKLNKELGNLKNRLWGLMAKSLESDSWVLFSPNFFSSGEEDSNNFVRKTQTRHLFWAPD